MADLGTGLTGYPLELDTNDSPQTADDYTDYLTLEGAIAAILAIETELGINPGQNVGTLLAYLQVEHDSIGSHTTTSHTVLADIGTNAHSVIDTHIADGTKHFLEGAIDHANILNIGTNTHAQVDTHIVDGTLHFLEGAIDHASITNLNWAAAGHTIDAILAMGDYDISLGTTTGAKIGTATSQKLGFWNSTPVIQQSSTGETVGFTAGVGSAVLDDSTFTGNVGATAYRISDIVKHLKTIGILAA